MSTSRINLFQLLLLAALISIIAQAFHETGHMIVYQIYRRNPTWGFIGLVQIWGTQPLELNGWVKTNAPDGTIGWERLASSPNSKVEKIIEAAAGPLASLATAILGLWIAFKNNSVVKKHMGLVLSLATSFTMTAYYLRSPLRIGGDEFDIASQAGISTGIVEIVFGVAFVLCLVLGLRLLDSWPTRLKWLLVIFLGSVSTGILLNIADRWVRESVSRGNPLFRPALGFSLPVLITYLLTVLGILIWASKVRKITSAINAG